MPNIPVPCYWTEPGERPCTYRCGLQALARHIKRTHKLDGKYGCVHCGFTHDSETVIRGHQCLSSDFQPTKGKIPKSHYATARYFRKLYQERSRFACTIPLAAFWCQSDGKNKKEQKPELNTTVDTVPKGTLNSASDDGQEFVTDDDQECVTDDDQECVTDDDQECVTDDDQEYVSDDNQQLPAHPCSECQNNITPYTISGIIQHRLCMGHKTIIDLDPVRLLRDNTQPTLDDLPWDFYDPSRMDNKDDDDDDDDDDDPESDSDELEPFPGEQPDLDSAPALDANEDSDEAQDDSASSLETMKNQPKFNNLQLKSMQKAHKREIYQMFIGCVKSEHRGDVEDILNKYKEVQLKQGNSAKECIMIALKLLHNFKPEKTVYALRKDSGWYCQVPQCGAIYSLVVPFAIKLHLEAHGTIKWYCGDASGQNCSEIAYESREEVDAHIAAEHMDSAYSYKAVRCVPRLEVSESLLFNWVDFECPVRILQDDDGSWELDAWEALGKWKKYGRPKDFDIHDYSADNAFGLTKPPVTLEDVKRIPEGSIKLLLGIWSIDEEAIARVLETYHAFCKEIGTHNAKKVLIRLLEESGIPFKHMAHILDRRLRAHDETIFNATLAGSAPNASLPVPRFSAEIETPNQDLPSMEQYLSRFSQQSPWFFTHARREYRRAANARVLAKYNLRFENIRLDNRSTCSGFWCHNRHYHCADSIALDIDTTRLLFVPTKILFTVANTCDYCVFVMSVLSRPLAKIPYPFEFGLKGRGGVGRNERVGIGSSIVDHASFLQVAAKSPLSLTPMAEKYRLLKKTAPHTIFIVDFESVPILQQGLPICLTEVTFRDGNNKVIESCIINAEGMTNLDFETKLQNLGYTHRKSFESARRIRGPKFGSLKGRARTPKEILQVLREHGFGPNSFWVEYSVAMFDRRCMEILTKDAGESPDGILPPKAQCWTVCLDFMRALPGLGSSYTLGNVAKLMNPTILKGVRLHHSSADTLVLYDLLHHWINVYGRGGTFPVEK
ncbi:hypothetical protein B0A52_06925 [Exophiala mesophila]|uniref:Uncharacterized protein n=1 Tax=Exophiala mesophila TaxID=212818 RepID=A0A438N0U0_EXOME|nr:hypothetical protein B0A52_06925 [Exophiala mesophila]